MPLCRHSGLVRPNNRQQYETIMSAEKIKLMNTYFALMY
jgi:hypothetical protein